MGMLIGLVIAAVIGLAVWAGLSPGFRQSLGTTVECMTSLGQRCAARSGDDSRVAVAGAPAYQAHAGSGSSLSANGFVRFIKGQVPVERQLAAVDDLAQRATDYLAGHLDQAGLHPDDREFVRGFVDGAIGLAVFVARLAIDPIGTLGDAVRPWVTDPVSAARALWSEIRDHPSHALGSFVSGMAIGKLFTLATTARLGARAPMHPVAAFPSPTRASEGLGCPGGVCGAGRSCFGAGTLVDTVSGPRAMETIAPGELVRSRDPDTGAEAYKPVRRTFVTEARPVEQLALVDGAGAVEALTVTPEHPFFVEGRGWVAAADLDPAHDSVLSAGGPRLSVVGVLELASPSTVYNLEVDDFHTYFVGHARAWVHNQCAAEVTSSPILGQLAKQLGQQPDGAQFFTHLAMEPRLAETLIRRQYPDADELIREVSQRMGEASLAHFVDPAVGTRWREAIDAFARYRGSHPWLSWSSPGLREALQGTDLLPSSKAFFDYYAAHPDQAEQLIRQLYPDHDPGLLIDRVTKDPNLGPRYLSVFVSPQVTPRWGDFLAFAQKRSGAQPFELYQAFTSQRRAASFDAAIVRNQTAYRGGARSPEQVKAAGGFAPQGKSTDIRAHVSNTNGGTRNSRYVSTATDLFAAKRFADIPKHADGRGWVFVVRVRAGLVPNVTQYAGEKEILAGRIPWRDIKGWYRDDANGVLGEYQPNPDFGKLPKSRSAR